MEDVLTDTWVLWYHPVNSDDWSMDGYEKWATLTTLKDYHAMIKLDISAGLFFLMKEGIEPRWEEPAHVGSWTIKIQKQNANALWQDLAATLVGGTLTNDPAHMQYINGISFSPKISNAIMKIWVSDPNISKVENVLADEITMMGNSMYQPCQH